MPEKDLILFVDDERMFAKRYIEELEKTFAVKFCEGATPALRVLAEHCRHIKAMVLDVMMPSPDEATEQETDGGFETGLWLLGECQSRPIATWPFPVIILTNRNTDLIHEGIKKRKIQKLLIQIHRKLETPAFALPRVVRGMLS